MNSVNLVGRLTKDPEIRYGKETQNAICRFTIAVDRGKRDGGADFPSVVCFGKTAETVEKYVRKGSRIAVSGRLTTGSYEGKNGKVYTTEVTAERVEFLNDKTEDAPAGFEKADDIPF